MTYTQALHYNEPALRDENNKIWYIATSESYPRKAEVWFELTNPESDMFISLKHDQVFPLRGDLDAVLM